MLSRHGAKRQVRGTVSVAVVVNGVDAHRSVAVGAVDDPQESLLAGTGRVDQGEAVLLLREAHFGLGQEEHESHQLAEADVSLGAGNSNRRATELQKIVGNCSPDLGSRMTNS